MKVTITINHIHVATHQFFISQTNVINITGADLLDHLTWRDGGWRNLTDADLIQIEIEEGE